MEQTQPDPLERVRQSTARVTRQARQVSCDQTRLAEVVNALDLEQVRRAYDFYADYHLLEGPEEARLNYVFTLDALNFGSGLSPLWKKLEGAQLVQGSLYKTVATALKRQSVAAGPGLGPGWAATVSAAELAATFGIPADFPLMTMFAGSLNEIGRWVMREFGGRYAALLESSRTATGLVAQLVSSLRYFDDRAVYDGEPVYFYKRAQILVSDLYLAFEGRSYGAFPDLARLTMFADNLLPHYFRMAGVLTYAPELAQAIDHEEPLPPGSAPEIELRAWAVQCVEAACDLLNRRGATPPVFPAQLDAYLWNYSQSPLVKSRPRHRTITYFY